MSTEDRTEGYLVPPQYVSVKEAARYLGVHYMFIWRRLGTPEGPPAKRVGLMWRIPKKEFLEWAEQPVIR